MTKEVSISPRFSPTVFDLDANSMLLRAHLCTVVDYMRRKPCVRTCLREREGLYNGKVQQNPLCAASYHRESSHLSPVLAYDFLSRCKSRTPTSTPLYNSINRLYAQNPVFGTVHDESVKVHLLSRSLYAYNSVRQSNLPSLPGSRQRFLIPMQIQ